MKHKNSDIKKSIQVSALRLGMAALITLGISHLALAGDPQQDSPELQMGATLSMTRDSINQLISDIERRINEKASSGSVDYLGRAKLFANTISRRAAVFEYTLANPKDGILPKLQIQMTRYNQIYASTQHTTEIKNAMLIAQQNVLNSIARNLSVEYQTALRRLMSSMGIPIEEILRVNFVTRDIGKHYWKPQYDCLRTRDCRVGSPEHATLPQPSYHYLRQHCYTKSCMTESISDEAIHLSSIFSHFYRLLSFTLADGSSVSINPLVEPFFVAPQSNQFNALNWVEGKLYFEAYERANFEKPVYSGSTFDAQTNSRGENEIVKSVIQELALTSQFPTEYTTLPELIQVSSEEKKWIELLKKQRNQTITRYLQEARQQSQDMSDRFEESAHWLHSICRMPDFKPEWRSAVGGCLSLVELLNRKDEHPAEADPDKPWLTEARKQVCAVAAMYKQQYLCD